MLFYQLLILHFAVAAAYVQSNMISLFTQMILSNDNDNEEHLLMYPLIPFSDDLGLAEHFTMSSSWNDGSSIQQPPCSVFML